MESFYIATATLLPPSSHLHTFTDSFRSTQVYFLFAMIPLPLDDNLKSWKVTCL